jgi:hypothetical protein
MPRGDHEGLLGGPSAIPEMLAIVHAARAVLIASSTVTRATRRELAAALEAFDRARGEDSKEARPAIPSAREVMPGRSDKVR